LRIKHDDCQFGRGRTVAASRKSTFKEESTVMNEQIRTAIRSRAHRAVSKDDLVRAVFDTFRAQEIDLRSVTLEDMKAALLEAARAAREFGSLPA
jgi:hypothetical protein